jgi:hypothetical protein
LLEVAGHLDSYFLLESLLTNLQVFFLGGSLLEMCAFVCLIMFFASRYEASGLGYLIIGLVHPTRSIVGLYIYKYLPSTPSLIEEICPEVNH